MPIVSIRLRRLLDRFFLRRLDHRRRRESLADQLPRPVLTLGRR
jgi:hypothetical protein